MDGRTLLKGWFALAPAILGVGAGLLLGALLIIIAGQDPLAAYRAMLAGAFGGARPLTELILKAIPLAIIGLGLSVAFQARVWNIGAEGQYFCGALTGSLVALYGSQWPSSVLIPVMLLAGLAGGALWAALPAWLRIKRGLSEIFTTLMLNYVAVLGVEYLARGPLRDPGGFLPQSARFANAARLPGLFGTRVHVGALIALALIPLISILVWHTPQGFRLRAIGARMSVARFAGIDVNAGVVFALVASGALAGLAGILEVSAVHGRLKADISVQYGFTAILVALLGRLHPVGVLCAALFFAALTIGATSMHTQTGLPVSLAYAIQANVVLVMLAMDAYGRARGAVDHGD